MTRILIPLSRARMGAPARVQQLAAALLLVASLLLSAGCSTAGEKPAAAPRASGVGQDKLLLERFIAELQRSSRSFVYLRSKGFTQSDKEFEQLIAQNNKVLRPTRIVRHDERGARQIPGWPGVALTPEFKASSSVVPPKGK